PPYMYTPTGQVFVREEDETAIASRDEIIALVRKSLGSVAAVEVGVAASARPAAGRLKKAPMPVVEEIPTAAPPPQLAQAAQAEAKAAPVPTVPEHGRWQRDERPEASARQIAMPTP